VEQLYAHPFIKAVAITDHNTIEGYHRVKEITLSYTDILIIPGVEIGTVDGDIIILGVTELPPKPWTVESVIAFADARRALTIAPHPYRGTGLGDTAKKYNLNAIETLNGISQLHINKQAENLAKEMNLPGVAGSDAHQTHELWTVYTEIQASSDVDKILSAIKKGLVRVASTGKSIHF